MCSSGTTPSRVAERGFVLATTLLVTTLLTVMLAASFLLVSAEQRTTDNSFGTARALGLAQAGLQNYLSQSRGLTDSMSWDSVRIPLVLGYANVVAVKLRQSGGGSGSALSLWVVRSTGVTTSPVMAGQVQGSRTIAQFAQLYPGTFPARAGLVALNGAWFSGSTAAPVSGQDRGPIGSCSPPAAADTHSVTLPLPSLGAGWGGTGSPPGDPETLPTWQSSYDSTHVNWASLVAGNFTPDYVMPPSPWPTPGSNVYQVGYVAGNATVPPAPPGSGMRGMLVVTGNLTLGPSSHWDGIILVGGYLVAVPGSVVHGMVVTGLNQALGGPAPPKDTIPRVVDSDPNNAIIEWSWCYTQSSVNALSTLVPIKNGWVDSWTTY